jgi:hypothetical protein
MDVYDAIRSFLVREQQRQHVEVELLHRRLKALNEGHRANPDVVRLSQVELASGQLHDAQAVESWIGRTLAGYPLRDAEGVA